VQLWQTLAVSSPTTGCDSQWLGSGVTVTHSGTASGHSQWHRHTGTGEGRGLWVYKCMLMSTQVVSLGSPALGCLSWGRVLDLTGSDSDLTGSDNGPGYMRYTPQLSALAAASLAQLRSSCIIKTLQPFK
jgi:hypothetical protein